MAGSQRAMRMGGGDAGREGAGADEIRFDSENRNSPTVFSPLPSLSFLTHQ